MDLLNPVAKISKVYKGATSRKLFSVFKLYGLKHHKNIITLSLECQVPREVMSRVYVANLSEQMDVDQVPRVVHIPCERTSKNSPFGKLHYCPAKTTE